MTAEINTRQPQSIEIRALILRACKHCGSRSELRDGVAVCVNCGLQADSEDKGTIAYWNKSRFKRLLARLRGIKGTASISEEDHAADA